MNEWLLRGSLELCIKTYIFKVNNKYFSDFHFHVQRLEIQQIQQSMKH